MLPPSPTRSAPPPRLHRRHWLLGCAAAGWGLSGAHAGAQAQALPPAAAASSSPPSGWLNPRERVPTLALLDQRGQATRLGELLTGRVSAVQLMFTGCNGSCPSQGALFAEVARQLPAGGEGLQLISLSVDALGDTPSTLTAWQARFGMHPAWRAAVPGRLQVDRMNAFFKGVPEAASATHTSQVFIVDALGRLSWRSGDLPPPAQVLAMLEHVRRNG